MIFIGCSSALRAKRGHFQPGIVDSNFDSAAAWAANLGWNGPFVLASDDTKIVAALRSYCDAGEWRLGGMHGKVQTFSSYEELVTQAEGAKGELAEKVSIMQPVADVRIMLILFNPIRHEYGS